MRMSSRKLATLTTLAFAVALLVPFAATAEDAGQAAFTAAKCNMCHSIDSLEIARTSKSDKMKAADLSNVGATRDAEWIVKYVKKEVQLEDKDHGKTFKGTDEELQTIAKWLATLKTDG